MRPGSTITEEEATLLTEQLRTAVARVCPHWPRSQREDLVQTAVVRVLELHQKSSEERDLSFAYLRRIAYSVFIDEIRRIQRRGETALESETAPQYPNPSPGPGRRAVGHELRHQLVDCLKRLIRPRRRAVILHLQGHTVSEIADLLGWGAKRAENLVYRGMDDLRQCLRRKGIEQ